MRFADVRAGWPLVETSGRVGSRGEAVTSSDTPTVAGHGTTAVRRVHPERNPKRQLNSGVCYVEVCLSCPATTRTPYMPGDGPMRTCEKPGCNRRHHARGFCSTHYKNVTDRARPFSPRPQCAVDGCDRMNHARGLCLKHYQRGRYEPAVADEIATFACVGCGGVPLPGGALRCLNCFHVWLDDTKGFDRGTSVTKDRHDPGRTPVVQARLDNQLRRWVA